MINIIVLQTKMVKDYSISKQRVIDSDNRSKNLAFGLLYALHGDRRAVVYFILNEHDHQN